MKKWEDILFNFLDRLEKRVKQIKFKDDLYDVESLAFEALPYLDTAAEICAGITNNKVLVAELAVIHTAFPHLFDGTQHTPDEASAYILAVASHLLEMRSPHINTTIARTAIQLAYMFRRAQGAKNDTGKS